MMVSKESQAPSEVLMCEAPILPSPLIHPSAWKENSAKSARITLLSMYEKLGTS